MTVAKQRLAILKAARARIADPAHWTQGVFARTADGVACPENAPGAVAWCALGALHAAYRHDSDADGVADSLAALDCLYDAAVSLGYTSISGVNDDGNHALVLAMYDQAIALVKECLPA